MSFAAVPKSFRLRFLIIIGFLAVLFLIFIARAYELAFHTPLPGVAQPKPVPIRRGIIFDSQGHELAISRDKISVGAHPLEVPNAKHAARLLAQALTLSAEQIEAKIEGSKDKPFVYLERNRPPEIVKEIRALKLPGIVFQRAPARFYPNDESAANIIGFVGNDNEGLAGIEYQFNEHISRNNGDFFIGNNIHLTINAIIQKKLENLLAQQKKQTEAKYAVGIISRVKSGKILAMASLPTFDPNFPLKTPESNKVNRAISNIYEPGSTFKMMTLASIFKAHLAEDHEKTYFCPGYFEYKGKRIGCPYKHGRLTLEGVIKRSCNTGIITASWNLPILKFYESLRYLGFGSKTEIQLPGESRGILHSPKKWDIYLKMSVPIGHGIGVTPLQLLMAANSLGNGGKVMKPLIVEKITSPENTLVEQFEPRQKLTSVSHDIGKEVRRFLKLSVLGGTGYRANPKIKNLSVCGKTGTTIKVTDLGSYGTGKAKRYQTSFLGFVPCEKPEISILVLFDEPRGAYQSGGSVAAPVFREVVKSILPFIQRKEIRQVTKLRELPYDQKKYDPAIMPNLMGKSKKETMRILWRTFPGRHKIQGRGYVISQNPRPGSKLKPPYGFQLLFAFPKNK